MEKKLIALLEGFVLPENFLSLVRLNNTSGSYFSAGFDISVDEEKYGLKTYSDDEQFLNSLFEFATADGSGSGYLFWFKDGDTDLNNAPIVAFGSEGGLHIVAGNFNQLLQILSFDCEPMIDLDGVSYYKLIEDHPSDNIHRYHHWLVNECGLAVIDNADDIVKRAQARYKTEFDAWVGQYI